MYPRVRQLLDLPELRRGQPRIVAGHRGLDAAVRWAHVSEVADIGHLLRGGEVVLTTGIALPDHPSALRDYVADLVEAGASGLIVELLRRWPQGLPPVLVDAAENAGLPVVTLAKEIQFVTVVEAVTELVHDAQLAELRAAQDVHERFTALSVQGAEPERILREVVDLLGAPVVLENLANDVLAYHAATRTPKNVLRQWRARSTTVSITERTDRDSTHGWLVTVVGARGDDWGRLIVLLDDEADTTQRLPVVVIERAAFALAMHRLVAREHDSLERQAHRSALNELLTSSSTELQTRIEALGLPLAERILLGVCVHPTEADDSAEQSLATQALLRELADIVALAARRESIPALVATLDEHSVRALVSLPTNTSVDEVLTHLSERVHRSAVAGRYGTEVAIAVGTQVLDIRDARRSLTEAVHVAQAAISAAVTGTFHRLQDVRLRGLLHLLRDDSRIASFAERELGPLLDHRHASSLSVVAALCRYGGNKSAAAAAAHVSRTAFYHQVERAEQLLGVSLSEPDSLLSLSVALLVWDMREHA